MSAVHLPHHHGGNPGAMFDLYENRTATRTQACGRNEQRHYISDDRPTGDHWFCKHTLVERQYVKSFIQ